MFKDFLLFLKYPYTAGIIAVLWLGSAGFLALSDNLSIVQVIGVDVLATLIIASIGFSDRKEV